MNVKTLISAICIILAICFAIYFWGEWEKARFDASLPTPPPEPADEQAGGHWHGDEWHADDAHENDTGETELIPSDDWQPSTGRPHEAVKPEGLDALDADDPVAKAWAKLDELAENRFAWGGRTSPQTAGLVARLTPTVEYFATEGDAEVVGDLLDELARLRDPRSIETLVEYQFGGNILTGDVEQALVAMGPPVVPHLIPYLDKVYQGWPVDYPFEVSMAADILAPIGVQHRADLDGIIKHIILPKLEERLANGSLSELYPVKTVVEQAIARLKR